MREFGIELGGCVYCSKEESKDFHSTSLEIANYRVCNEINVTISIIDKNTNEIIEE